MDSCAPPFLSSRAPAALKHTSAASVQRAVLQRKVAADQSGVGHRTLQVLAKTLPGSMLNKPTTRR